MQTFKLWIEEVTPIEMPVGTKLSPPTVEILTQQVGKEIFSAYLYTAMSVFFEAQGLVGYGHWFDKQAEEEMKHGHKIIHYLVETSSDFTLPAIESPKSDFGDVVAACQAALDHEKKITDSIKKIADLANQQNDHVTRNFIDWFLGEQVEEEDQALNVLQRTQMSADNLIVIDQELAKRE